MGKYDIDASLTSNCKLSLYDLIEEIDNEFYNNIFKSREAIVWKLKNQQQSGLINKLLNQLHFDIETIAKKSDQAKFEMLKLLKELYIIEKIDIRLSKEKELNDKEIRLSILGPGKIKIIDILSKPRMSNIKTYFSDGGQYGRVLDILFSDVESNVYDSYDRIKLIDDIIAPSWLTIPQEGVMNTFFNILLTHRQLCYDNDRIRLNDAIHVDIKPSEKYSALFRKYECKTLIVEKVKYLKKSLNTPNKSIEVTEVLNLISYFEDIPTEDHKHYNYAFENITTVLDWIMKEKDVKKNSVDFSEAIPLTLFVTIIQEIVNVKKNCNDLKIRIDYSGYNASYTSLLSALKKSSDKVEPALIDVWNRRIETRFSCNYGAYDNITEKNKAEINLCKIKNYIFRFQNLSYIKIVHDYLFHLTAIAHINSKIAASSEHSFRNMLNNKLQVLGLNVNLFAFTKNANNIYDMFRELHYAYQMELDVELSIIAESISRIIRQNYNNTTYEKHFTHKFMINYRSGIKQECFLDFQFNYQCRFFFYDRFGFLYTDKEKEVIHQLGLQNLFL